MLFVLIKNELIKLMKKSKTWIVFALFAIFIGVTVFGTYKSDKDVRYWQSPEKQLEYATEDLNYINKELENLETDKDLNSSPEYIENLKERKIQAEVRIKLYEDMIKNGVSEDAWKLQLDENIKNNEESLKHYEEYNDEWAIRYKLQIQEEIDRYKYLRDNNIEPLYGWEYESYGYMKNLMTFLGMAILVCGIAVFMSDIVSGECTPATLKFLLIQPVTRGKVLLSKFISVTITVLTMILGSELIGFIFVNLTSKISASNYPVMIGTQYKKVIGDGGIPMLEKVVGSGYMGTNSELLIKALLFQGLFIITTCAAVFLISTLIKSSMITMAVSVITAVFITIGSTSLSTIKKFAHLIFVNYGDATGVLTGNSALMYNNENITVGFGVLVMIITIVISYIIAYVNFNKKDILI